MVAGFLVSFSTDASRWVSCDGKQLGPDFPPMSLAIRVIVDPPNVGAFVTFKANLRDLTGVHDSPLGSLRSSGFSFGCWRLSECLVALSDRSY